MSSSGGWLGPAIGAGIGLVGGALSDGDQQATTTQELPAWATDAMQYNIGLGQQLANRPYVPYTGQRFAGFNPMQQGAMAGMGGYGMMGLPALMNGYNALTDVTGQNLMGGAYGGLMDFASGMAQSPMGYDQVSSMMVNPATAQGQQANASLANRGNIQNVSGGSFLDMNLADYMNPYTQQVIQQTTDEMDRARQIQLQQSGAAQHAAGAFGGSRHGVADSLTNAEFFRNQGNMANLMNQQAYDAATGLMGQDLNRGLQANLANQGMDWNVQNLNANLGTQNSQFNAGQMNNLNLQNALMQNNVGLANAGNALSAALANQSAGLQANQQGLGQMGMILSALQGAGSLGNQIGQLGLNQGNALASFGQGGLASMLGAGNQMQALDQMNRDFDYQQFLEARDWYPNQFQYALAPLQGMNFGQTTSQDMFGPSMWEQGLGGLMMGMAMQNMWGQ